MIFPNIFAGQNSYFRQKRHTQVINLARAKRKTKIRKNIVGLLIFFCFLKKGIIFIFSEKIATYLYLFFMNNLLKV